MTQLYQLLRVRKAGWLIPKYQHAFGKHPVGSLRVTEEYVPDLHRHSLMARLLSPGVGNPVEGILDLYDVRLLHWASDLITLAGFERTADEKGLKVLDCAQTWILQPAAPD